MINSSNVILWHRNLSDFDAVFTIINGIYFSKSPGIYLKLHIRMIE